MALFSFFKGGVDVDDIQDMLTKELGNQIRNLKVEIYDTRADLFGECDSIAIKEKAILLTGNVKGIEKVNSFHLKTPESVMQLAAAQDEIIPSSTESSVESSAESSIELLSEVKQTQAQPEPPHIENALEIESQFYEIKSGDSLWKIAQKFYGDGNKYKALFAENKEIIKDPDKIYPGQMIRIPKL